MSGTYYQLLIKFLILNLNHNLIMNKNCVI
jgi:hypothetical protein